MPTFPSSGPTAAGATVSGRILDANGRGSAFARVVMSDQSGEGIYAVTNPFGYFNFADVTTAEATW